MFAVVIGHRQTFLNFECTEYKRILSMKNVRKVTNFCPLLFFTCVIFWLGKGGGGVTMVEIKGVTTGKYTNTLQVKF